MERSTTVALLYPGDRAMRDRADPRESRFVTLFDAFESAGITAEPAVYHDDFADEVAAQLRRVDGVLVWHNPIESGRRRDRLDTMLKEVAQRGVFVSSHPDAVLRLGTKDVLLDVRELPFGSDTVRVDSLDQLAAQLPGRLRAGARVLKQHRGCSGVGVWRVEAIRDSVQLRVRHAQRGSEEEVIGMPGLLQRMTPYFETTNGGHTIDQAWQPRLVEGMVRAYLIGDRVGGFGHQAVNALYPGQDGKSAPPAGPRLYYPADLPQFQYLRRMLETQWVELLRQRVGLPREHLPLLWDCDFMFGEPTPEEPERYVLCEINVSSVSPFPPSAVGPVVSAMAEALKDAGRR
ncbi:hypothetical protein CKY39_07720 [Variovorax boronicumulans]|uniref:DUF6815 domain-containing protein n=2 Tax=Variovorax boronicumulans TaxID=436515 RepID=A0A286NSF3_9BURK|nr:hypothetical protein CKY39_07720 [Variovorax boronicumulans]